VVVVVVGGGPLCKNVVISVHILAHIKVNLYLTWRLPLSMGVHMNIRVKFNHICLNIFVTSVYIMYLNMHGNMGVKIGIHKVVNNGVSRCAYSGVNKCISIEEFIVVNMIANMGVNMDANICVNIGVNIGINMGVNFE
jgi:hypothetical protein